MWLQLNRALIERILDHTFICSFLLNSLTDSRGSLKFPSLCPCIIFTFLIVIISSKHWSFSWWATCAYNIVSSIDTLSVQIYKRTLDVEQQAVTILVTVATLANLFRLDQTSLLKTIVCNQSLQILRFGHSLLVVYILLYVHNANFAIIFFGFKFRLVHYNLVELLACLNVESLSA